MRYRARSLDNEHAESFKDEEIKVIDEDEETNNSMEITLRKLNQDKHKRKTIDLSALRLPQFNQGMVNKAVLAFKSKLSVSKDDSKSTVKGEQEENMTNSTSTIEAEQKENIENEVEANIPSVSDGVAVRRKRSSISIKNRVRSMIERS